MYNKCSCNAILSESERSCGCREQSSAEARSDNLYSSQGGYSDSRSGCCSDSRGSERYSESRSGGCRNPHHNRLSPVGCILCAVSDVMCGFNKGINRVFKCFFGCGCNRQY